MLDLRSFLLKMLGVTIIGHHSALKRVLLSIHALGTRLVMLGIETHITSLFSSILV